MQHVPHWLQLLCLGCCYSCHTVPIMSPVATLYIPIARVKCLPSHHAVNLQPSDCCKPALSTSYVLGTACGVATCTVHSGQTFVAMTCIHSLIASAVTTTWSVLMQVPQVRVAKQGSWTHQSHVCCSHRVLYLFTSQILYFFLTFTYSEWYIDDLTTLITFKPYSYQDEALIPLLATLSNWCAPCRFGSMGGPSQGRLATILLSRK